MVGDKRSSSSSYMEQFAAIVVGLFPRERRPKPKWKCRVGHLETIVTLFFDTKNVQCVENLASPRRRAPAAFLLLARTRTRCSHSDR